MENFEYKSIFFSTSIVNADERIEWLLNFEGAKGWEICGMESAIQDEDEGIRLIMKRSGTNILAPYVSRGYSENQLRQIYLALKGNTGYPITKLPVSQQELDYFLENAIDLFNEDHHSLGQYCMDINNGINCDESINTYKEWNEKRKTIAGE